MPWAHQNGYTHVSDASPQTMKEDRFSKQNGKDFLDYGQASVTISHAEIFGSLKSELHVRCC